MKTTLVVAAITLVGGASAIMLRDSRDSGNRGDTAESAVFTARRGKLTVTVTENGTVMAKDSTKISVQSKNGGKIVSLVEEGKHVEQDEILCTLDTTELEAQVHNLELDVLQTLANLDKAKTELEIQVSESAASEESHALDLAIAEKELEKYELGDGPKELRDLTIAIKSAELAHTQAKQRYDDTKRLLKHHYSTAAQLAQDEIAKVQAEVQLTGANGNIELFKKYTYPMTMTMRQAAVTDAKRELENSAKRAKSELRQKEVAVESQSRRLTNLKLKLGQVKDEIEAATIRSPTPGIAIYGDPAQPWYRTNIQPGGQVYPGMPLFTIPDLRVMQVQVRIHEADINKIKEGQRANVTMDTYPGMLLEGHVTKIGSVTAGSAYGGSGEVKKFTVDLVLDSTQENTLRPGISAKVEIFVDQRDDVLSIPLQSIFVEEGRHFCRVQREDGSVSRKTVKVGLRNDSYVEIVAGLTEGDVVLLYNPALRDDADPRPSMPEPGMATASTDTPSGG